MLSKLAGQFIALLICYSIITYYVEAEMPPGYEWFFYYSELTVAIIFTVEYFVRWFFAPSKLKYPFTWQALIDLAAVLPFWAFAANWTRVLRLVRLFKLNRYNHAFTHFFNAFWKIRQELAIVGFVSIAVILFGSVAMYEVERTAQAEKFAKLSDSVWYTVVTLTTVGYGDVYPITTLGRLIAVAIMVCGIGIVGTFISLLGAGLVDELKKHKQDNEVHLG